MKRFFILLLCIIICLIGCASSKSQEEGISAPEESTAQACSASVVDENGNLWLQQTWSAQDEKEGSVSCDVRASAKTKENLTTTYADDHTLLFTQQLQETAISIPEAVEIETRINDTLCERREIIYTELEDLQRQAEEEYYNLQDYFGDESWSFYGYSYYTADTVTRLDGSVFSMTTYYSTYTGGAHPNNVQEAVNFSLQTGEKLTLAEVLQPQGEASLEGMILEWLETKADDFGLFDEYQTVVADKFQNSALDAQSTAWYFSNNGLVVFFNPYDITPYAAGVVKIEFPYESLTDVLEPDYLPVYNSEESSSAPVMCFPANVDSEEYETLEWVDTSDDGVQFALYANGTIYNLSLKLVDWVGGQIITQRSVYAANYLSESNVVIVQVDAANSDAYMQLEYGSSGSMQSIYFGLSYQDGVYQWITK